MKTSATHRFAASASALTCVALTLFACGDATTTVHGRINLFFTHSIFVLVIVLLFSVAGTSLA